MFDARARVVQYYDVEPKGWLTSFVPAPAAKVFEIPFDKIAQIRSRPKVKQAYKAAYSYTDSDEGLLFEFAPKYEASMLPDFTLLMKFDGLIPPAIKAVEDLVNVMGQLLPNAQVDFQPNIGAGGFGQAVLRASSVALIALGTAANDASNVQQGQQVLSDQQQRDAATAVLKQSLGELKTQDGRSFVDLAFEDEGLKRDLDTLLTSVLQ